MRKELARATRRAFGARLSAVAPQFEEMKGENVGPGSVLYAWQQRPGPVFYILLQFHRFEDWFTLELASSRQAKWPAYALPRDPWDESPDGEVRFRLGRLWEPRKGVWWEFCPRVPYDAPLQDHLKRLPVEELLPKVGPLVDDAIEHVVKYALPYIDQFSHGQPRQPS